MPRDGNQFDVALEHSGAKHTYRLSSDPDTGKMQWFAGLVEEMVPQQNISTFSYEALPASLSTPISFESWVAGAGHTQMGTNSPSGYSYSRGVDASWGDRLLLSPERQEAVGVSGTVLGHYTSPTFGEYLWTASRVYQWTGLSWVERYGAGVGITDIIEWGNSVDVYLLVASGDANDIVYSIDGETFPASWAGERATYLAVRGHNALDPILCAITSTGAVATALTIAGGLTAADQVGSAGALVNGVETVNDVLVLLKQDGVFTFDGADVSTVINSTVLYREDNGTAHVQWLNGKVYFNYGNRLLEFDAVNSTIETVYAQAHPELNGDIVTVSADAANLYLIIENMEGNRYIMKGVQDEQWSWHTWVYLGSSLSGGSIHTAAGGAVHGTNPVVIVDDDYYILPRDALRPEDDSAYRFESSGGFIVGPLVDAGARVFKKFLNGGRVVLESTTAARPVVVQYGLDRHDATPTTLVTGVQDGLTVGNAAATVSFTRVHYHTTLTTGDNQHSPRVLAIVFDTTPMPPRRRRFTFVVEIEHMEPRRGSGDTIPRSYLHGESHLFNAVDQYVILTDPLDRTFAVKVRDVAGLGLERKTGMHGGAHALMSSFQVTADEIVETTPASPLAIWDQTEWDDGSVYSGS